MTNPPHGPTLQKLFDLMHKPESHLYEGEIIVLVKGNDFAAITSGPEELQATEGTVNPDKIQRIFDVIHSEIEQMDTEGMPFFKAIAQSKEDEALRNVSWTTQRIINGGGHFFWEEGGEVVRMSGEFCDALWVIEPR